MRFLSIVSLFWLLLFTGCSSKHYYEPTDVQGDVSVTGFIPSSIEVAQRNGATLNNDQFISKDGISHFKIKDGYRYINRSENYYFAAAPCGDLAIYDKNGTLNKTLHFDREVLNVAEENNYLAAVLANNEILLYDLKTDDYAFKQKDEAAVANDIKVAAPHFLDDLVIFPTLDGKMVIVSIQSGEVLRNIAVSSGKYFNNVIFMEIVGDRLVAATQKRAVSVSPEFISTFELDIRDVIFVGDKVYLFSKQGEIVLTDADLREIRRKKFPFAHFDAAIYGDYVYGIESQGYIVAVDRDLLTSFVYELSSSIDGPVFSTGDRVYFRDYYFELKKN